MTYRIISTFDGSITNCSLSELSSLLKINSILCELNADDTIIDSWPLVHGTLVTFAVEFAEYALNHYTQKKIPEAEACNTLTRKWLKNAHSVSNEELRAAANAAYAAPAADAARAAEAAAHAADAARAAEAAAHAADAARAAEAAAHAARAAHAAAYAAADAAYAAHAAAAGKSREAEYVRQGVFIVEYLRAAAALSCDKSAA
jgi:pyruvate/2-oxoglutarate dehydrogenase complex dihydrolipoamide acyltransferase (E2) component